MSTIHNVTELGHTTASTVYDSIKRYWAAFQERREHARLRGILDDLSNRELRDIGIARDEIYHVALNRSIDPRGARSDNSINV